MAALEPFATLFDGPLDSVGGGTLVSPTFKVQLFKEAKAALAAASAVNVKGEQQ